MAVRINTPQTIGGQNYPAGMLVVVLDAREEEQLAGGGGAGRVNLPPVSAAGTTIAAIGDSLTDNNYTNTGVLQAYSSIGYLTWAMMILGQRLTLVNEGGVGGNKSADLQARLDRDLIAFKPKYGVVMAGVNNLFGNLAAVAIFSNLVDIYTRMRAAGITPMACTVTPATYSAAQTEQWTALNALIVDYARSTRGMLLCDMAAALMSATDGVPLAGTTSDGIHLTCPHNPYQSI